MSALESVTDETFEELVLRARGPVLVDFWAEWCPPCRAVVPILEAIAEDHRGALTILKLDVDDNLVMAERYRALALPVMIVFVDGEPVKRILGAKPRRALDADLADYLGVSARDPRSPSDATPS